MDVSSSSSVPSPSPSPLSAVSSPDPTPVPTPEPEPSPSFPWTGYQFIAWDLCLVEIVGITIYAVVMAKGQRSQSVEDIVTARRSITKWKVVSALYSATMGAWVVATPAFYSANAGLLGLFTYSISAGLSMVVIAYLAPVVERRRLHPLSFCEFIGWRYGAIPQIAITLLAILNMTVFMLVELMTMGNLFQWYVGSVSWPIIVAIGVQTLIYSSMAGLNVSIAVGQAQAGMGLFLVFVLAVYLIFTFQEPLPPMTDAVVGRTELGFSSLLTMPASLIASAVFNEAMWQRAFAAEDPNELRPGAVVGAVFVTAVVFFCGLCGWLAVWEDPSTLSTSDTNVFMLQGLQDSINFYSGTLGSWIGYIVVLLACIMCFGAVDSLQTGLLAAFASLKHQSIRARHPTHYAKGVADFSAFLPRLGVLVFNVALIALSIFGSYDQWPLLDTFLIANMMGCAILIPSLCGLTVRLQPYFGGGSFMLSWLAGLICPSLYGIFQNCSIAFDRDIQLWVCVAGNAGDGAGPGLVYTWFHNFYRWQYFLLALGGSTGAMVLCAVVHAWTRGKVRAVWGFHPEYGVPDPSMDPFSRRLSPSV